MLNVDLRLIKPRKRQGKNGDLEFALPCLIEDIGRPEVFTTRYGDEIPSNRRHIKIKTVNPFQPYIDDYEAIIWEKTIRDFHLDENALPIKTTFNLRIDRDKKLQRVVYGQFNMDLAEGIMGMDQITDEGEIVRIYNENYIELRNWLIGRLPGMIPEI